MRKFLIATALVAVAACGDKAAEGAKDSTPAMAPAAAPAAAPAMDSTMKMDSTKKDSAMAPAAAPAAAPAGAKKPCASLLADAPRTPRAQRPGRSVSRHPRFT